MNIVHFVLNWPNDMEPIYASQVKWRLNVECMIMELNRPTKYEVIADDISTHGSSPMFWTNNGKLQIAYVINYYYYIMVYYLGIFLPYLLSIAVQCSSNYAINRDLVKTS